MADGYELAAAGEISAPPLFPDPRSAIRDRDPRSALSVKRSSVKLRRMRMHRMLVVAAVAVACGLPVAASGQAPAEVHRAYIDGTGPGWRTSERPTSRP